MDTEAWSETYISSKVDDEKMAGICRLFDYLYSEEGSRLVFCGFEGEDYDLVEWSETYISSKVDDEKMAGICRLFDYLYSEEGSRLVFCGFEGEDYDLVDGKVVMKDGVVLGDK